MPIRIDAGLPAKKILENENIFVMDYERSITQHIRPLNILIMNLMPTKQETELQLLRSLSNTPLQINITFLRTESYDSTHVSATHLDDFYSGFSQIKDFYYDGLIITGAPVENMAFEEVDYWDELVKIMEWSKTHVTSTFHICWAGQAGLYYHYGIQKYELPEKMFGVFMHKVAHKKTPLIRGFDDEFMAPHSRHTYVRREDIENDPRLAILADSEIAGPFIILAKDGRQIFVMGHPEYDIFTLDGEYQRDLKKNMENVPFPCNYYKNDDPAQGPVKSWRCHANTLYTNWLNYYVYQMTTFNPENIKDLAFEDGDGNEVGGLRYGV